MIRRDIGRGAKIALGVASVVAMLAAYSVLSYRQHARNPKDTTIPTWSQLADGVGKMLEPHERTGDRWLVVDTAATATRLFLGLGLGVVGALVLGIVMGVDRRVEAVLVPPLSLLAKIPPTAALAVFFVMVGTGTNMFVAMIAFGVLPSLAQTTYLAVKEVPNELIYKAYTLGATGPEVVWNVVVPHVLPKVLDGIRLQIGPAVVYLIAAEMVVGDVGFGYRIRLQSRLLSMNVVYPYLALLAAFGFGMDLALRQVQKAACPWYAGGK